MRSAASSLVSPPLLLVVAAASLASANAVAYADGGLVELSREPSDPFSRFFSRCSVQGEGGVARYPRPDVARLLGDYVARVDCPGDDVDNRRNNWQKCLNASLSSLDDDGAGWTSRSEMLVAATSLLYASLNRTAPCAEFDLTAVNSSACPPPVDQLSSLYASLGNNVLSRSTRLLQLLKPVCWNDKASRNPLKCFNSRTLLLASGVDEGSINVNCGQLTVLASHVVALAAAGYSVNSSCPVQPSDGALIADLLQQLNGSSSALSLPVLLTRLGIGQASNSKGSDDHHEHDDHDHDHHRKRANYLDDQPELKHLPVVFSSTNHNDHNDHEHDHNDDDGHGDHDDNADQVHASPRQCLNQNQLLSIYGASEHDDGSISMDDLRRMCPALLQQVVGQYCTSTASPSASPAPRTPSVAETYGYGTLAVITVGAMPLIGVFIIPCLNTKASEMILTFFVALGAGAMLGDALLHLVPSILGEHNHRHEDAPQLTEAGLNIPDTTWKMLVMCLVIYAFFVLEMVVTIVKRNLHPDEEQSGHHGHSHSHVPSIKSRSGAAPAKSAASKNQLSQSVDIEREDTKTENEVHMTSVTSSDCIVGEKHQERGKGIKEKLLSVSPVVFILMLGDALHNFADGLTIGASFATRLTLGLTSTIAIVSHEVPHKLANIAVLLSAGYSQCSVLIFSLISTCAAVASFYIGAVIGKNETVASYIFAATAASFFYVCLLDLLPEIMHRKTRSPWKHFLVMNTGILTGFTFMLLFSIFEDRIDVE